MGATRRVVIAVLILVVAAAAWAQPHAASRDHLADARATLRAQNHSAMRDVVPRDLKSPLRIETQGVRVVLSAVAPRNAFIDDADGIVVRDAASLSKVGFDVAETAGVIGTVRAQRGIRFVAPKAADSATLAAPILVDARGRPSANAAWSISRAAAGRVSLRLETHDRSLQYPVRVFFSAASAIASLSNGFHPAVNATGAITGRLTDSVTNAPITDEFVGVYDSSGDFATYGITDSNGDYRTADGLVSGNYYVLATAYNYAAELYNNIPCNGCNVTTGTAVTVVDGQSTNNINFALTPTFANISGTVLGNGSPLPYVTVVIYDATGTAVSSTSADESGNYLVQITPGGPYYARTNNVLYPGYIDQLYSGIDCVRCDPTTGTAITAAAGSTTSGVNFNLSAAGGAIAGTVTDVNSAPVYARVDVYDSNGDLVTSATTDAAGQYTTVSGLSAGDYYVTASASGFTDQLYDGHLCNACSVTTGDAVTVPAGQIASGIDFVMTSNEARVSGRVFDATTTSALADIYVNFYDATGAMVVAVPSDENGNYSVVLPEAGTYYARTMNFVHQGYVDQLYDATDCSGCPVTGGTAIEAVLGQTISGVDFAMKNDGGSISGTITEAANSNAIAAASVLIFSDSGELASFGTSDGSGNYSSFNGLTSGTFYAVGSAVNFGAQLYDGIACGNGCTPTSGTAITVTRPNATTGIDFALTSAFGRVSGTVISASNSQPLAGATVNVYYSNGSLAASVTTDAAGNYVAVVDAAGNFYAVASYVGFADQLYDQQACEGCNPTTGDPIAVTLGQTTPNIDFILTTPSCASIILSPDTLPGGVVSDPYSQTITATNAVAPVSFAVTSGALPGGLTLSSGGVLSGTPTATGSFTFVVTATDANGCVVGHSYTIEIAASGTPTTTTLTASPSPAEYLQPVTLTATVSPSTATGTVGFFDDATFLGNATLSGGTASIVVQFTQISKHENLVATYNGNGIYQPSTSAAVTLDVTQATPPINWAAPAPITYPTALSGTQLNATSPLTGTFVYSPPAGTVLDAGTYTLSVTFTPDDPNYKTATKTVQLVVNKATQTINWSNPADIVYGTPLGATQLNATVTVPGPSPAGALTYTPPAGTILNAGTHTLTVDAAETINYLPATKSVTLIVLKATPSFSNLSAPTIIIQQPTTTISGKISFGSFIPTGSVSITINGVTQSAAIQADGTFSSVFNTAALMPPGYTITYAYAGDANFNPISATTTLSVRYATSGSLISGASGTAGSTFNFRVYVYNYAGVNISDPSIPVIAYGARLVGGTTWILAPQPGQQGFDFDYQNAQGHSYLYNLKTTGFAPGTYVFGYRIGADPTIYEVGTFTITP